MTKEEVRSVLLGKLRVAPGDTLWDVGAGTGSVSEELALLAREGRVFAVERGKSDVGAIKQAMTWQAYALANSNALDGMASSTRLVSVRTWYDNALVAVQVVFAALTVLAAAMYVLNDRKSKKQ